MNVPDEIRILRQQMRPRNYNVYMLNEDESYNDCLFSINAGTLQGVLVQLPLLLNQTAALMNDALSETDKNTVTFECNHIARDKWIAAAFVWNNENQTGQLIECVILQKS